MKIAISKSSGSTKYERYAPWLRRVRGDIEVLDLASFTPLEAARAVRACSGLLLTGGEDIEPSRYGKKEHISLCEIDPVRDAREWAAMEEALTLNLPILGICRGMQLLNVFFGGTLITDIPTQKPGALIHGQKCGDAFHEVLIEPDSLLARVVRKERGMVTSSHHQSVETLAPGMQVSARAPDGICEGLEWEEEKGRSFLLGVQWHPERMERENPLSRFLAEGFLAEVQRYLGHGTPCPYS